MGLFSFCDLRILGCREQFSKTPNVIRQSRCHRGSDSQSRMDAAEIVVCEMDSDSVLFGK